MYILCGSRHCEFVNVHYTRSGAPTLSQSMSWADLTCANERGVLSVERMSDTDYTLWSHIISSGGLT